MPNPFDGMSDEDILKFVRENSGEPEEKKPEAMKVTLGDGSVIEASNAEELNRAIQARIDAAINSARPTAEPTKPEPQAPAQPKFDMKTFTDKFVVDPDEGLEYLEMSKYGMPIRKAVPQMLAITAALVQKVQELENANFAPKEDAERKAVEQIMRERNWQPSRQSFEDALYIAKAKGMIGKPKEETKTETNGTVFIPPRLTRGNTQEPEPNEQETLRAAENMPLDKLEDLLIAKGIIKTRRVS